MSATMKATLLSVTERLSNFDEVYQGYNGTQAILEANRCLLCENAPCTEGCPAGIDVRGFIRKIRFDDNRGAVRLIRDENIFAGVCGRVCPTEMLCEQNCRSQALTDPIRIGALQRFLTDWEMEVGRRPFSLPPADRQPVAVIGAGPAGLAAAAKLRLLGYPVTVFEQNSYAGGAMVNVIPRFKLPRNIVDYDIQLIRDMGVEIRLNEPIGKTIVPATLLEEGFSVVLLAVGRKESYKLGIAGEDLEGVYSALDLLTAANQVESAREVKIGKHVIVIGGGSAALNSACCALRMGAERVELTSRRTPAEMGAFEKDKLQALDEGVQINSRFRPTRILGKDGKVVGLEGVRVLGKEGDNVTDMPDSRVILKADTVVIAIGQRPDQALAHCFDGLEVAKNGCLMINPETGQTSDPKIFAAGDILAGNNIRTVVQSVAEGKTAAHAIHEYLSR